MARLLWHVSVLLLERLSMKRRCSIQGRFLLLAFVSVLALSLMPAEAGEESAERPREIFASLWTQSRESGTLMLASFDETTPLKSKLSAQTQLEGVCQH